MDIVKFLESKGIDIFHKDKKGNSACVYAAQGGFCECFMYLLTRSVDFSSSGSFYGYQLNLLLEDSGNKFYTLIFCKKRIAIHVKNEKFVKYITIPPNTFNKQKIISFLRSEKDLDRLEFYLSIM
ncbi:hypothetical protein CCP3SC15_4510003 [Gammaproteobacteria bacterium]